MCRLYVIQKIIDFLLESTPIHRHVTLQPHFRSPQIFNIFSKAEKVLQGNSIEERDFEKNAWQLEKNDVRSCEKTMEQIWCTDETLQFCEQSLQRLLRERSGG